MKTSLALGPRRPLDPQKAWGCLLSNIACPGLGTLVAGRRDGYAQLAVYLTAFALTSVFGLRFFVWYFNNHGRLLLLQENPPTYLREIWLHLRWALLGIALFAFSWVWALITSLFLLRAAKRNQP